MVALQKFTDGFVPIAHPLGIFISQALMGVVEKLEYLCFVLRRIELRFEFVIESDGVRARGRIRLRELHHSFLDVG